MWGSLKEFKSWYFFNTSFMNDGLTRITLAIPENPVKISPELGSCEFILFREGQYQAELITLFSGKEIPPHSHPNVDSIDFHMTGTGESFIGSHLMPPANPDRGPLGNRMPIPANVPHWGHAMTDVAVISLQKWKNGVAPSFLSDDWEDRT